MSSNKWFSRTVFPIAIGLIGLICLSYIFTSNGSSSTVDQKFCEPLSKISEETMKDIFKLQTRDDFGWLLEKLKFKTGAELGVHMGLYSSKVLNKWPSMEKYYLVDIWKQQQSYIDMTNLNDTQQEQMYKTAKQTLKRWADKTVFLRMFTTEAAKVIPDNSLDFVYVDARHDYCGVKQDLEHFWPKVKVGGILSGHDYFYVAESIVAWGKGNNYGVCGDGSYSPLSVKGAVQEFASSRCLFVFQVKESWLLFK